MIVVVTFWICRLFHKAGVGIEFHIKCESLTKSRLCSLDRKQALFLEVFHTNDVISFLNRRIRSMRRISTRNLANTYQSTTGLIRENDRNVETYSDPLNLI